MVEFVRSFHLGGTEGQVVELLRGLPRDYEIRVAVTHDAGPLLEQVWQLGHFATEFSLKGSVGQLNTFVQIARIATWLRRNRIRLVHAHDFYTTLLAVPAAQLAKVPIVVGRLDLAHFHTPVQRQALITCTRAANHVIANADAIRQMLVKEEMIPPERISVIHNGLDLTRFDQRARERLRAPVPDIGDAPVVIHVANLAHPVKRQEDLLTALAILKQGGRMLRAWLVGDGPRRPEIQRMAQDLGVADRTHFLGQRTDVPALLVRATLGVLCSSSEGMSNSIIEGMAAGLPMVVTRVGGNPDLILDGERGYVVEAFRPAQLADAFIRMLDDPEQARHMAARARAFVEKELTLSHLCERHDQLYRRVAARA
ncbi:MAG: glycosyltransferase [Myxococcaceae bacterium]